MKKKSMFARVFALMAAPAVAFAQAPSDPGPPPPPPPPPTLAPAPAPDSAASASTTTAGSSAASGATASSKTAPDAAPAAPASVRAKSKDVVETSDTQHVRERDPLSFRSARGAALAMTNTLDGATGLLRVISADSGEVGTFRLSLSESFFSGSGFLCPNCSTSTGAVVTQRDHVSVSAQRIQLSLTPAEFLEVNAALRYQQTSNNRGVPSVIQISGDTWIGAKAFLPAKVGRVWGFGGGAELGLLSEARGVGTAAADVLLHLEGTLDLTRRERNEATDALIPLRAHVNLGYLFDNSGAIADDIERSRASTLGGSQRITRIERFGFDVNRVDSVRLGLGVEGTFSYVRPFAEWSLDIPANRQGHKCARTARSAGDQCLSSSAGFSTTPSRLTLGVRGYPWLWEWSEGISLLAAVDIGTGATSTFIEEVAPELPWQVHLGLGYAFDTRPRVEKVLRERVVKVALHPPVEPHIEGTVVDAAGGTPIAHVAISFADADRQGMLTDANGNFRTTELKVGSYRFQLEKEGYATGECTASIGARAPAVTALRCELRALPKSGDIVGVIRDAESTEPVLAAAVQIRDPRNRSLSVQTDGQGNFRFENVPAGVSRLEVEVDGYLPSAAQVQLKPREVLSVQLSVHKRPKLSNVIVTKTELKLRRQVHFLNDSSEILPDSLALVEEIADALRSKPEIGAVEIQGHTDNSGTPEHNRLLSEQRAESVREALLRLGVEPNRLTARGYGQDKPLVPNSNAANKTKNRRVQLMIQGL